MLPKRTKKEIKQRRKFKYFTIIISIVLSIFFVILIFYIDKPIARWISLFMGIIILSNSLYFVFKIVDLHDIQRICIKGEDFVKRRMISKPLEAMIFFEILPVVASLTSVILFRFWSDGILPELNIEYFLSEILEFAIMAFIVYSTTSIPKRWKLAQYNVWSNEHLKESIVRMKESSEIVKRHIINITIRKEFGKLVDHINRLDETIENIRQMYVPKSLAFESLKILSLIVISLIF